jgi:hypothetical protein
MRTWLALGLMPALAASALAGGDDGNYGDTGREGEAQPLVPEYLKPENCLSLKVSAATPFVFIIDAKSVSVGLPFAR